MTLRGRAFVFGDRIDTDLLAPAAAVDHLAALVRRELA